jgi:parallel beta-helix repeat protein
MIVNCDLGIYIAEGVSGLLVDGSTFRGNRIGIWIGTDSGGIEIRNSGFDGHADSAIWSVRGKLPAGLRNHQLALAGNHFRGDRISVVLANTPVLVEDNEFVEAQDAALFVIGEGAVVRRNRIRSGNGAGIIVDDALGTLIDSNEVDHNRTLGILVRSSALILVQNNHLYSNVYGVGFVLGRIGMPNTGAENRLLRQQFDGVIVIGESPVLRDNQALNNKHAGVRVLDFMSPDGARTASEPLLEGNVLAGNQFDYTLTGEYRVSPAEGAKY